MSSTRRIDFVVAGGAGLGLGHVARSAALAVEARRRGWAVRAFLEGDDAARATWRGLSGAPADGDWASWRAGGSGAIAALDFPRDKRDWLERLAQTDTRSLVVDDPCPNLCPDWILLPALHHALPDGVHADGDARPPRANAAPTPRLLAGPRYSILSEAHRRASARPQAGRRHLLLSMGGADPHRIAPRIAPSLVRAIDRAGPEARIAHRDVVLGAAFEDPGERDAKRLAEHGWTVHRAVDAGTMARLMSRARLAVIGFGTSLTELAWHGTPFLSVAHHAADRVPARDLAAQGIGVSLGTADTLDLDRAEARVTRALGDLRWQMKSAAQAYEALDGGRGVERVFETLEAAITTSPSRRPGDQPPGLRKDGPAALG